MVIVTGPYSSPDKTIKEFRIKAIATACVLLMQRGEISVSPLTFGLALIEKSEQSMPDSFEFWNQFCLEFVGIANKMYVLNLEGWELSSGTKAEIVEATRLNIPIYLVDPLTLEHIKQL